MSNTALIRTHPAALALAERLPTGTARALEAAASTEPVVRELHRDELGKDVLTLCAQVQTLLGHKKPQAGQALDPDLLVIAAGATDHIRDNYPQLRLAEIKLAFHRGAAGEYLTKPGDFPYLNLSHIGHWLRTYCATARKEAMQLLRQQEQEAERAAAADGPDPQRIAEQNLQHLLALLDDYRRGLDVFGPEALPGHWAFAWLEQLGLIRLTNKRKWNHYQRHRRALLSEIASQGTRHPLAPKTRDLDARNQFAQFKTAVTAGLHLLSGNTFEATVRLRCRNEHLRRWAHGRLKFTRAETEALLRAAMSNPQTTALHARPRENPPEGI